MKENETEKYLIRNQIFTGALEQKFLKGYRKFFSIHEIETSSILQWSFGAFLLTYYITFYNWVRESTITIEAYASNKYSCWSYFQNCGEYYFLKALPYGYSQTTLYVGFFALMVLTVYLIWKKEWVLAHFGLLILFIWKVINIFVLTVGGGNYDYYDLILSTIFLFFPYKLFFLKLVFVLLYFLASTIKIHEGWLLGSYFTSLHTGLPIFGNSLAPFITNIVIFMQVVGAWFLLSEKKILQRIAVSYFLIFHLYSGILVQYRYMTTAIPMLLVLFGPLYSATKVPLNKKSIAGWIFILILFIFQSIPFLIKGDHKLTLEGNRYGLYMFEANHQCVSSATIYYKNGKNASQKKETASARNRCDPYRVWFNLNEICKRSSVPVDKISWTLDHSINGSPFYRIVDIQNACSLTYRPFAHNTWIKTFEDSPEIVGYPVKNIYN